MTEPARRPWVPAACEDCVQSAAEADVTAFRRRYQTLHVVR